MTSESDSARTSTRGLLADALAALSLMRLGVVAHGLYLFIISVYALGLGIIVMLVPEVPLGLDPEETILRFFKMGLMGVVVIVIVMFIDMALYERPKRPALRLARKLLEFIRCGDTWAKGVPMFILIYIFMLFYSQVKATIPILQPFAWDETFDRWDLALHFGQRPWEWLHPVLGHADVTSVISFNYSVWLFVMIGTWMYFAFVVKAGVERTRFFLTFMFSWMVGGSLIAILLSSAGPCFYGEGFLGIVPDPYARLMAYLHVVNQDGDLLALSVQKQLWNSIGEHHLFFGISAMPSMHNASAMVWVLASRSFRRWVRWLFLLHFILVYLGSIHLAWHYAVDAYVAWAVVLAAWYVAGHLARWWESRPASVAFRLALESHRGA